VFGRDIAILGHSAAAEQLILRVGDQARLLRRAVAV
jgi:hypothetical protein